VQPFAEGAPNLQPGVRVNLVGQRRRILKAREDRGAWLLLLEGLASRTAVEPFRGALLEVPDREVRRADEESYFVHELIGLRVETAEGRALGEIVDVLATGANDVYVVREGAREVLIPAIEDVIERIDVAAGLVVITPLPGLLDEA
jgi:16S rRNA processing protein RimM